MYVKKRETENGCEEKIAGATHFYKNEAERSNESPFYSQASQSPPPYHHHHPLNPFPHARYKLPRTRYCKFTFETQLAANGNRGWFVTAYRRKKQSRIEPELNEWQTSINYIAYQKSTLDNSSFSFFFFSLFQFTIFPKLIVQ